MISPQLRRECSDEFRAVHDSGPRLLRNIRYIVIHSTESPDARGTAQWFADPASSGSSNLVVGVSQCYRTVPDLMIPWAAPPLNQAGFHLEIVGYAAWSRARWLWNLLAIRRAAYKAALRCRWYGIPPVWLDVPHLLREARGVTSHANVSAVWHQSDHTDPGPGFPYSTFLWFLERYWQALA